MRRAPAVPSTIVAVAYVICMFINAKNATLFLSDDVESRVRGVFSVAWLFVKIVYGLSFFVYKNVHVDWFLIDMIIILYVMENVVEFFVFVLPRPV